DVADVARVEEAVFVDRAPGRWFVVQVTLHDLRAADPDLSILVAAECGARGHVGDLALRVRHARTDRARHHLLVVGNEVGHGAGFGQAVALAETAPDAGADGLRGVGVEWRRTREGALH